MLRLAHPIIPFITEELWQTVGPLAGKSGPSIMLQPYPVHDAAKRNPAAVAQTETLKALVMACRSLRSEMNLGPDKRPPLIIAGERDVLEPLVPYLQFLGKRHDLGLRTSRLAGALVLARRERLDDLPKLVDQLTRPFTLAVRSWLR